MPGFLSKISKRLSRSNKPADKPADEPVYSIQPAPAEPPQAGTGLQNDGAFAPFKAAPGPVIPNQEQANALEGGALSREEIRKRAEELNKE